MMQMRVWMDGNSSPRNGALVGRNTRGRARHTEFCSHHAKLNAFKRHFRCFRLVVEAVDDRTVNIITGIDVLLGESEKAFHVR